eukprot:CAMPEP_0197591384 /NCGR_PEP_ID=MMETSP1326-20131121/13043_1 /TAXON_ID=1155430 /ORGANISM="Genus nov. species nov., Strain RCC2288" /LENGTH=474 /DNA_ID=CAMNT_0043156797 /DNA_START=111 /DNA_END=1531 /DNA_ORIENTATION=-
MGASVTSIAAQMLSHLLPKPSEEKEAEAILRFETHRYALRSTRTGNHLPTETTHTHAGDKRRADEACEAPPGKQTKRAEEHDLSTELPDDLWLDIAQKLQPVQLAAMSAVSQRFRKLANSSSLWRTAFEERWGTPSLITERAVVIAGDWKALFGAKVLAERAAAPWWSPCAAETEAMVHSMCDAVYRAKPRRKDSRNSTPDGAGDNKVTAVAAAAAALAAFDAAHTEDAVEEEDADDDGSDFGSGDSDDPGSDGEDDLAAAHAAYATSAHAAYYAAAYAATNAAATATASANTDAATEDDAAVHDGIATPPDTAALLEVLVPEVVFLIDGSGSVTDEDFSTMKAFLRQAGAVFLARHPDAKLGVVQFANDLRVERELTAFNTETEAGAVEQWTATVDLLARMNGGTNFAAPLRKAEKMFGEVPLHLGARAARVVALVTDGRVDSYQAQEAVNRASRLSDVLDNFEMYAFGVGRG